MPKDIFEIETQVAELSERQQRAIATNGWDTIANRMDAGAFLLALPSVPRMDTWAGIAGAFIAYTTDLVDGTVARHYGVDSETLLNYGIDNQIGKKVDAVGDKIKFGYAFYNIWKNNQAPKSLLAAVAMQNLANAAITAADTALKLHGEPELNVSANSKTSTLWQNGGIGLNVIGTKVAETKPGLGRAIKISGTVIGFAGLIKYGIPATKGLFREFKDRIETIDPDLRQELELKRAKHRRV